MRRLYFITLLLFAPILASCASQPRHVTDARNLFLRGHYLEAAESLEQQLPNAGRNELLYLLESGSAFRYASQYERSCANLERADELARINSYVSLSEESTSIIFDYRMKLYRSPEYERIILLYLLAFNRLQTGEVEKAMVELRRLVEYEAEIATDDHKWLRQPLAHYLYGLCFLRFGELDNARREFRIASEMSPDNLAYRVAFEGAEKLVEQDPSTLNHGWALVIVETGLAPQRVPSQRISGAPAFMQTYSHFNDEAPSLFVNGEQIAPIDILSIEALAVNWLEKRTFYYLAREVGSVVAKSVIADQIGKATRSKTAESIAFIGLMLARRPDLRSWANLPQQVAVFAIPLNNGEHKVELRLRNSASPISPPNAVQIVNGRMTTVSFRAIR